MLRAHTCFQQKEPIIPPSSPQNISDSGIIVYFEALHGEACMSCQHVNILELYVYNL